MADATRLFKARQVYGHEVQRELRREISCQFTRQLLRRQLCRDISLVRIVKTIIANMSMRPDDHRRKWNREEYERIALQRLQDEIAEEELGLPKQPAVKRELLKQRDYKVDLESKLGKSVVINKNTPSSQTGGYYCNVCDCVVKDSINFLDHINGTKHQRNLGMSMKIERSTLDQVKARFAQNKKKLEEKKKDYDLEQRVKELKEEITCLFRTGRKD
ncbi:zinc finger matrin-type protein 2 isoform X2 [Pseudomyrmex gracilis]|uniref:zinc finger matrin-type protein 2 isoform X2 n=1 Tax=Pseudomyrmex gracilis TaxID=219809 RepID=UPI000995072B|nr:zinc finger matrin-type protein 2 isoform X2 [Pseudomyrmex gracilis]